MSLSIILVRHGESEANVRNVIVSDRFDPPLTPKGRQDTKFLAQQWKDQPVHAIYASPLKRTLETARIWAETFQIDSVQPDDRLHEIHLGAFDGQVIDDLLHSKRDIYEKWKQDPESPPPGGEKLSAVGERVHAFLTMAAARHHTGFVIAVSHADCLKAATLSILRSPWESAQYLHFANVAAIVIQYHNHRFQLLGQPVIPV